MNGEPEATNHIFLVHGTWAKSRSGAPRPKWHEIGSKFQTRIDSLLTETAQHRFYSFDWSGKNSFRARRDAAAQLLNCVETITGCNKHHRIVLIGHSHGGNVVIEASEKLKSNGHQDVDIITLATPSFVFRYKPDIVGFYFQLFALISPIWIVFWLFVYSRVLIYNERIPAALSLLSPIFYVFLATLILTILIAMKIYNEDPELIKAIDEYNIIYKKYSSPHLMIYNALDEASFLISIARIGTVISNYICSFMIKLSTFVFAAHIAQMYFGAFGGRVCNLPKSIWIIRTKECSSFFEPLAIWMSGCVFILCIFANLMKSSLGSEMMSGSFYLSIDSLQSSQRDNITRVKTGSIFFHYFRFFRLRHSLHEDEDIYQVCADWINRSQKFR